MEIRKLAMGRVKITLNLRDMKRYDIDFNSFDWEEIETRRVIWDLLSIARDETGFNYSGGGLLIEAFPFIGGGGSICFTCENEKENTQKGFSGIFVFDSGLNLLDCIAAISSEIWESITDCALYAGEGKYALRVTFSRTVSEIILEIVNEFGKTIDKAHGKDILSKMTEISSGKDVIDKMTASLRTGH